MSGYTTTPRYALKKPTVGADDDLWGSHLNANADIIDNMAPLDSPAFTGNPTAPTPSPGDSDTSVATTAFVTDAIATAVGSVPGGAVISDTPPAVSPGALWWDSTGGQLYVRYDDGVGAPQWVAATNLASFAAQAGSNNVGRNLVHNPLFNVAQRGAGPFTGGGYTADRWGLAFGGGTARVDLTPMPIASGVAIGDEAAKTYLAFTFAGGAGTGDYTALTQPIEDVRRLSGKTVILSFWAMASAVLKLGANLTQSFGTGGSSAINGVGQSVTLSTAWARYSLVFVIGSASGKTIGTTNNNDNTQLAFWCSAGATIATMAGSPGQQTGTINIWGVQLEIAQPGQTTPTSLEKPDLMTQLQQCQRFFVTGAYSFFTWSGVAGQFNTQMISLPVQLRSTTVTITTTPSTQVNVASNVIDIQSFTQVRQWMTSTGIGATSAFGTYTVSADL